MEVINFSAFDLILFGVFCWSDASLQMAYLTTRSQVWQVKNWIASVLS